MDGSLLVDGRIGANAAHDASGQGGGAGGTVFVVVNRLLGSGSFTTTDGGSRNTTWGYGYGGGGGRIAIYYETNAFLGQFTAAGGTGPASGGAGSVFLQQGRFPTRVAAVKPVGRNEGYLQQLDSIVVRYTRPVRTDAASLANIRVQGPGGSTAANQVVALNTWEYRYSFPVSFIDGSYQFTIFPSLVDLDGFVLSQPGGTYFANRIVDSVPPRVLRHSPAGDIAGTIGFLDVTFSERVDLATFVPSTVALINPAGSAVAVSAIQELGRNLYRISFPPQTLTGQYRMGISSNATDLAGNAVSYHFYPAIALFLAAVAFT